MGPFLRQKDHFAMKVHWLPTRLSLAARPGSTRALSDFWLLTWSISLSIGWLLPNHYPPWSTFHFDAWSATAFCVLLLVLIVRVRDGVSWTGLSAIAAVLVPIPLIQYAAGVLVFAGNAWISTAYLLGFLLAVLAGARWASSGTQAADGLFLAIGIASLLSVGLQLHQWFSLGLLDIWSMGDGFGRPFANFGQPNQLGTFLLWGILAAAWGYVRGVLRGSVFVLYALFLLFGLSLTASRTAWVAIALLVIATWCWRGLWPHRRAAWVVTLLAACFALCVLTGPWLSRLLTGQVLFDAGDIGRVSGESRQVIWTMFLDAALERPLWGYGWNQVSIAQMAVVIDHPSTLVFFSQSHNLFLDIALWCGVPMAVFVFAVLATWFVRRVRAVQRAEDALLVLLLVVVGNHAMLEFPLHYAYMLLPTGVVMGLLETRLGVRTIVRSGRWVLVCLWLSASVLLSLLVRDYMRVESSYQVLRFEWARIKTEPAATPDVLLLTQWRDYFQFVRLDPHQTMTNEQLVWMRHVVSIYPSPGFFQRLATALAVNNQPQEAALWLRRLCKVNSALQCAAVEAAWIEQGRGNALVRAVPWPR